MDACCHACILMCLETSRETTTVKESAEVAQKSLVITSSHRACHLQLLTGFAGCRQGRAASARLQAALQICSDFRCSCSE